MRVHIVVPMLTLIVGLAVGYGLSLLMDADTPRPAETTADPAAQVRQRETAPEAADRPIAKPSPEDDLETDPTSPDEGAVERVEVSGRVVDVAGEPVPGLRFRWTPGTPSAGQLPQRTDFAAEAEWRAALRARLHRGVDLRVEGISEIVSGADGSLRVPGSVAPNGTLELLDPEWMTLSANVTLPIRPENIIRVARAAELDLSVEVEGGQPARKGRVEMRYKHPKLTYWSPSTAAGLPAVLRVPAGEAVVELENLDIGRKPAPTTLVFEPGKRTRLAIVLPQQVVLAVRAQIPPGSWLSFGLVRAREGLTDEETANEPGAAPRQTEGGIEFAVDDPGEYVFFCRASKTTLDIRRLRLERGRTELALTLTPQVDLRRLLLRVTLDGKPLDQNVHPEVFGLEGLVWERAGGDFTWLLPQDARPSVVSINLDKVGILAMPINPATRSLEFAFVTPVQPRVIVRGARAEVRGNASISLEADSPDVRGYQTNSKFLNGTAEPLELTFAPMQPGRYRVRLHWNAGLETMGRWIDLGLVDVGANSVHTLDMPPVHVLTVALPPKSVRGWLDVLDTSDTRVAFKTQDGDSHLIAIRFLQSGTYTLRWQDKAETEHVYKVEVNADKVVRPLGD